VRCELYVADTTGISTPSLKRRRKAFKTLWVREHVKLHALVGLERNQRAGSLLGEGHEG